MPTSISGAVADDRLKTSSLGDCAKKYQQALPTALKTSLHMIKATMRIFCELPESSSALSNNFGCSLDSLSGAQLR